MMCVCVAAEHGIIVLEQGMREIFVLKRAGVAGDGQNCTVRSCMVCAGQ